MLTTRGSQTSRRVPRTLLWSWPSLTAPMPLASMLLLLLLLLMLQLLMLVDVTDAYPFRDVSKAVGLDRSGGRMLKYGGPAVADLDGDGWPDLLFGHHNQGPTELYFNQRNGKFKKANWGVRADVHAFVPFRTSPFARSMHILLAQGGGRGLNPNAPLIFRVFPSCSVTQLKSPQFAKGRGRSAVFMSLRPKAAVQPDVVFINARPHRGDPVHHFGASQERALAANFKRRPLRRYTKDPNWYATAADVNGDGHMELLPFQELRVYRVVDWFLLRDDSSRILPRSLDVRGVVAVAEFDFDNDGRMDLYLARTVSSDMHWLRSLIGGAPSDILLRNVGGRFVDVSRRARIPRGVVGGSRGVTTGDFNNDGWVDIIVSRYSRQDLLLLNRGDGTFRTVQAGFRRPRFISGDAPTAVDYDRDGRLDVILSEGDFINRRKGGYFRVMRNLGPYRNWLLVRVGNSPRRSVTSLHALVTVRTPFLRMVRRVGTPGTAVSISYIELAHFGLGGAKFALKVSVRWVDGSVQTISRVRANRMVVMGKL